MREEYAGGEPVVKLAGDEEFFLLQEQKEMISKSASVFLII